MNLQKNFGSAENQRAVDILDIQNHEQSTIISIFNKQCLKHPDRTAVEFNDKKLSYHDLNNKAELIARALVKGSINPGDVVAVKINRSIETILAIMGILKAGAVFLCIDPSYPQSRIDYMLTNSGARCLISDDLLYKNTTPTLLIHEILSAPKESSSSVIELYNPTPEDLSYIIYTSGTTGNPKGGMITHAGLVNMIRHHHQLFTMTPEDKVLQFASISFDAAIFEIFLALLSGASLVLISKETIYDKDAFLDYIKEHKVTATLLPPVFLNSLGRPKLGTFRILITGGEACNFEDARYYSRNTRFFNAYGPSEASVIVSIYEVDPGKDYEKYIPIGKAINNITFYILDDNMKPVPEGEAGELYVSGIGVGKGYINNDELTKKFFIRHPEDDSLVLYKTGDLVRKLEDGNIVILGRKDSQVKILGHRIELSAIEAVLAQVQYITNALVLAKEDEQGQKYLVAYYTATRELKDTDVRNQLLTKLPAFMAPQYLIQIREFILNNNGKVDKSQLPEPKTAAEEEEYIFEEERDILLASVWKQVLGVPFVKPDHHFFTQGGHSLKAAEFVIRLHKQFHIKLQVADIYKSPVFGELSELLKVSEKTAYKRIAPAPTQRYYPLSSAQRRMYIMSNSKEQDISYNVSVVLQFSSAFGLEHVQRAASTLIYTHEILRTRYVEHNDDIVQEILTEVDFAVEKISADRNSLPSAAKSFIRPFNLSQAPIIRVGYVELKEGGSAIILDSHHIAVDGTSVGIIVMELIKLLHGEAVEAPEIHYKDYASWETSNYNDPHYFGEHEKFWLGMYSSLPSFRLPSMTAEKKAGVKGERIEHRFNEAPIRKVYNLISEHNISLFQFFLANYYLFLNKYTQREDIVVGTAVANRNQEEVQNMPGMFVNTLGIRQTIDPEWTYKELLTNVSENVIKCFQYQEYPFELLIEKLGLVGNDSGIPLIDTTIVVQNLDFFRKDFSEDLTYKYENNSDTSKFGISIFIIESKENFFFQIDYDTNAHKHETIVSLINAFETLMNNCTTLIEEKIGRINLVNDRQLESVKELLDKSSVESLNNVDFDF